MKVEIHHARQGASDKGKKSRKVGVKACCGIDQQKLGTVLCREGAGRVDRLICEANVTRGGESLRYKVCMAGLHTGPP
jgi:hypothetical protein